MGDNEITALVGWPTEPEMAKFRKVVAAAEAAERERCAKLCEAEHVGESLDDGKLCDQDFCYNNALRDAAAAIRGA